MKLYWGDIHNHCGITYGYGALENALNRAKAHLDFCAITGHAMWPDMYRRSEETAFVVDFHNHGFQKLRDHWDEVKQTMAKANDDDFVTFQAYEMHSSEYGDHHLVTPDDALPLIERDSPGELLKDSGCDAITVAHHIGYTPGYRGINWDQYDEHVTPLIEVCSKHGCAMSEDAAYPYYHNMGPRDSRNTVYEGLKRGYHFGFVGSTDHHAGYPGSYGDGKMAVLAEEKTRESIWDAMKNRRTYAVTGDRIKCRFEVDHAPMGSIVEEHRPEKEISFSVEACYLIDKIVIYRNLEPVRILDGLMLRPKASDTRFKLRIEMGWGNNEEELYPWDFQVKLSDGRFLEAEPCFRGRSVLAPGSADGDSKEDINQIDNRMVGVTDHEVSWVCQTIKNPSTLQPQTCAVILELEANADSMLEITGNGHYTRKTVGELCEYGFTKHMKPYHSQAFKVHTMISESQYKVEGTFTDKMEGTGFYHMEVHQRNNHHAYVTPVYFK